MIFRGKLPRRIWYTGLEHRAVGCGAKAVEKLYNRDLKFPMKNYNILIIIMICFLA